MFDNVDLDDFWDDSDYAVEAYMSEPVTEQMIQEIEKELGYKLPESYIYLMKKHNGGMPKRDCCPCDSETTWADDHIAIRGIYGIGRKKANSLCGEFSSRFWIDEWEYPDIGVAICDCPSAGHDMIFLDYRECGANGEPKVVHIDEEWDYSITVLAENFEEFIGKLCSAEVFHTDDNVDLSEVTSEYSDDFWDGL